ncbi:MAG: aldo/keto reductase [Planctomycetota bacterium]
MSVDQHQSESRSHADFASTEHLTKLGLGCWAFGGAQWGGQDDKLSYEALEASFAAGITHLDTARAYANGASERVLAPFLAKHRGSTFLATKGNAWNAKPEEICAQLEASLEDLGVDHVDLYYMHWPVSKIDMKPLFSELEAAREQKLIKRIGVSNFSVRHMEDVSQVAKIDAHQVGYSLLWRKAEAEVMPYCREHGISVVTYSSMAQGILTGKFGHSLPTFPEGDDRTKVALFDPQAWPHIADAVEAMKSLAEKEGQPLVNLAVQWVARQLGVVSVLLGARNREQAIQNAATLERPVADETLSELTKISDEACRHLPNQPNIFGFNP